MQLVRFARTLLAVIALAACDGTSDAQAYVHFDFRADIGEVVATDGVVRSGIVD